MTLSPELAAAHYRRRAFTHAQNLDKLDSWRFGVPRLKEAFRMFTGDDPIDELHCRGPNKTGKTLTAAAFTIACLQKRPHLDGVPIPQWKGRVKALQLVLDFPQQLLSVKPAYEQLLDGWPCHIRTRGDYLHSIHVMPVGGNREDEHDWSVIYFLSQKNRDTGRGARADVVHFDEPPQMFFLRELRKAGGAGRRSIRIIGETPEHLREWAPIREDYGDTPRRSIRRVTRSKAEVRWSLEEVASWVLSDTEKAQMREEYANDPLKDAREHGDYTNAEGSTPWGEQGMLQLLALRDLCRSPVIEWCRIPIEVTAEGESASVTKVAVQVYAPPTKGVHAYINIDPSSGVDDGKHHEAAMHVSALGSGDLLARWAGYLPPYSLGVLAAEVGRQYGEAVGNPNPNIDIEMKDHWGVNVHRGAQAARYGAFAYEQRELQPGKWAKELGFDMNEEVKAIVIGQIQEWLESLRAGRKYGDTPSREVIETLINAELDERGKVVAGPGLAHGHDMILRGQAFRRIVTRINRELPTLDERTPTKLAKLRKMMEGDDGESHRGFAPQYRDRPRV